MTYFVQVVLPDPKAWDGVAWRWRVALGSLEDAERFAADVNAGRAVSPVRGNWKRGRGATATVEPR